MAVTAQEALVRLQEGNRRFVSGVRSLDALSHTRRAELASEQNPFAIVLGCSDSRVPAEVIFDQGLGDLFVIRVAGNIVAPSQVGSVEFAAARYETPLVVVLGHTRCGAILATLEEVRSPTGQSPNIRSIVDRIRPTVETLLAAGLGDEEDRLVRQAARANVRASADHLRHGYRMARQAYPRQFRLIRGAVTLSGSATTLSGTAQAYRAQDRLIGRKISLTGDKLGLSMPREAYPPPGNVIGRLDKVIGGPASISAAKQPCRPPEQRYPRQDNVIRGHDNVIGGNSRLPDGK
jgi:carbonic anhydrase